MDYAIILTIIGFLTVLTNLLTQVIKPMTYDKLPTTFLATILAEALTLAAYFGYSEYAQWTVTWYTIVAAIVVGMLVSYAAQYGFDKLKEALLSVKEGDQ